MAMRAPVDRVFEDPGAHAPAQPATAGPDDLQAPKQAVWNGATGDCQYCSQGDRNEFLIILLRALGAWSV